MDAYKARDFDKAVDYVSRAFEEGNYGVISALPPHVKSIMGHKMAQDPNLVDSLEDAVPNLSELEQFCLLALNSEQFVKHGLNEPKTVHGFIGVLYTLGLKVLAKQYSMEEIADFVDSNYSTPENLEETERLRPIIYQMAEDLAKSSE